MTGSRTARWIRRSLALAVLASAATSTAVAQATAEPEVKAVVMRFLAAAGANKVDAMAALFAPGASIASARLRDGKWVTAAQTAEAWLAAARSAPAGTRYTEPVHRFTVHVEDGQLAFVRAEATVMRDGRASSRNVDYFTLLRDASGAWKIVNGSYTAQPPA